MQYGNSCESSVAAPTAKRPPPAWITAMTATTRTAKPTTLVEYIWSNRPAASREPANTTSGNVSPWTAPAKRYSPLKEESSAGLIEKKRQTGSTETNAATTIMAHAAR